MQAHFSSPHSSCQLGNRGQDTPRTNISEPAHRLCMLPHKFPGRNHTQDINRIVTGIGSYRNMQNPINKLRPIGSHRILLRVSLYDPAGPDHD